jgi:hypothetical protein
MRGVGHRHRRAGSGSFVLSIKDRNQIKEAIRTKLVPEVSSQTPETKTVTVVEELRVNLLVGDKMYHDPWGRNGLSRTLLEALQGRTLHCRGYPDTSARQRPVQPGTIRLVRSRDRAVEWKNARERRGS